MITNVEVEENDSKLKKSCKGALSWFFDNNDFQGAPLIALLIYIIFLLGAISSVESCNSVQIQQTLMMKWIRFEAFLFLANIVGIAIFMFTKSILSRFDKKITNSIVDERSMKLTDALSRH
jgi:hypothetical protein